MPAVFTDKNGGFAISGSLNCPSPHTPTYLTVTGGDPGVGVDNPALAMMAALGPCANLGSIPAIVIDEVTTVAAVWATAPFLGTKGVLGTSSTNPTGLSNAMANAANFADISTGTAPGVSAARGARIPLEKINTLADILAACVNSSGSGTCDTLFAAATPPGGTAPDNTLDVALDIARNPSHQAAALFAIATPTSPFQPALGSAPADWTLAMTFTGGGLNSPGSIAIDADGNLWAADYFNAVSEFSNTGVALSPTGGFIGGGLNESYGLAIGKAGGIWVTNEVTPGVNGGHGSLTVLNSSGAVTSGKNGVFGGGVDFPVAVAGDTDGSIWIADYGDSSASKFSSDGSPISGSGGFAASQLAGPVAVAIDAGHRAWLASQDAPAGSVTSISSDGSQVQTTSCGGEGTSGVATDSISTSSGVTGHVWTANFSSSTVSELQLNSDGSVSVVSTGFTGGGLNHPNGIAVDGAGNVWLTNFYGNTVTELAGAKAASPGRSLSPASGFGPDAKLEKPYGIAVDSSGNVWVSNFGSSAATSSITQFPGVATPVQTPLLGPAQLP